MALRQLLLAASFFMPISQLQKKAQKNLPFQTGFSIN